MSPMKRREFAEAIALASLVPLLGPAPGWMPFPALEPGTELGDPASLAKLTEWRSSGGSGSA